MSLQVWLPLDGDLRNQGLNGENVTNHGATVNSNGKIGQCYQNTASNYCTIPVTINSTLPFSMCFWYRIDTWVSWGTAITLNDSNGDYIGICPSSNGTSVGTNWYEGSTSISDRYHSSTFVAGTWYHFAIVSDGNSIKTFINGIQSNVITTYSNNPTKMFTQLTLFKRGTQNVYGKNSLNDVRVYDHCLSYKEISELAKGLILHYRLSKPLPNLLKNSTFNNTQNWGGVNGSSISTIVYDEKKCLTGTKGTSNNLFCQTTNINYTAGTIQKYKFSALIYSPTSATIQANIWINSGGWKSIGNVSFDNGTSLNEGWNYVTATITANNSSYSGQIIFSLGTSGTTIYLTYPKIEEGEKITNFIPNESDTLYSALGYNSDIELDCAPAGNQNDGTIVGTITAAADSPRYESSYYFNGSSYINAGDACRIKDAITVSCWVKPETTSGSPVSCIQSGGWGWQSNLTSYLGTNNNGSNAYVGSKSLSTATGVWMHIALTFDGTTVSNYLNGSLVSAATCPKREIYYNTNGALFIGGECDGNMNTPTSIYKGNISDVRIYCTALSSSDIAELYQTAAQVDKDGNVYAYEFKEA